MSSASLVSSAARPVMPVLAALSVAHLLNDTLQSMIPAIYPLVKDTYHLDFAQIGLITLAFQVTSSLLQPLLGYVTDRRPWPHAMVAGMAATLAGILGLAFASSYGMVLASAALVGTGSAVFHPEATRMARHAAAGRQGLAQGVFQIGGHVGYSIGPLLAAAVVVPNGQASLSWFSGIAVAAMLLMSWTVSLYVSSRRGQTAAAAKGAEATSSGMPAGRVAFAMTILILLLMSKNAYQASFTSYYTFYLIERFGVSVQASQLMLFGFLVVGAAGVILGGMLGDRIGRGRVIWISILGPLPLALILPYADLFWTGVLSVLASFIMASAFSSILIYAIDLVPHRVGLVGGLFYGLSFGLGGLAAGGLGLLADRIGIVEVFRLCAFLPAIGLLAFLLPRRA
ncbi:Fosmidomycin resistance protein [Methylobacterium variabile]|jgi:FSR family fosmidomycin resistance protein-like MFS transporter|uniref:Fosmidomycin resistance protein n=1 Tax=Methylobacterium variabile TaxID=298794 RepID=A0A0J6SRF0_9HYPH|nr:MFS transporter [Methylobacterium variabile]KMO36264.1 Fosmidomycin resistance protein [Methylobacterium variabile]